MKTQAITIIAMLALGGCASLGETMATKEPSLVFATSKTPKQFRDCYIASTPMRGLTASEYEDGYIFVSENVPGNAFTVKPVGQGSEVKVWGLLGTRNSARACM